MMALAPATTLSADDGTVGSRHRGTVKLAVCHQHCCLSLLCYFSYHFVVLRDKPSKVRELRAKATDQCDQALSSRETIGYEVICRFPHHLPKHSQYPLTFFHSGKHLLGQLPRRVIGIPARSHETEEPLDKVSLRVIPQAAPQQ